MHLRHLLLLGLLLGAAPATQPTTRPATEILAHAFRYAPPLAPWKIDEKATTERSIAFTFPKWGAMRLTVQAKELPARATPKQLADVVIKTLTEGLKGQKDVEVVTAPHVVEDGRFFLRIDDQLKETVSVHGKPKGYLADGMHLYRVFDRRLVSLSISSTQPDKDEKAKVLQAGLDLLLGVKPLKGPAEPARGGKTPASPG